MENPISRSRPENQDYVERILGSVASGIVIVSLDSRIAFANQAMLRMLGMQVGGLVGQSYYDSACALVAANGRPLAPDRQPFARVMRSGKSVHGFVCLVERPAAQPLSVSIDAVPFHDSRGALAGVAMSFVDITPLAAVEQALDTSRKTVDALLAISDDATFVTDAEGTVLAINDACARLAGVPGSELVGASAYEGEEPLVPASRKPIVDRAANTRQLTRFIDDRGGRKFESTICAVQDSRGQVARIVIRTVATG